MRTAIAVVVLLLALALVVCAYFARRSKKAIAPAVVILLSALIPPVLGNLLIIAAHTRGLATLGCYIYFLGMDYVMFGVLHFTLQYCELSWPNVHLKRFVYALLILDAAQLLLNPVFGHAFTTEMVMAYGAPYYRLVPLAGQTIHRLLDYGIFLAVLVIFLVKAVRAPRIYSERYSIIFLSMIFSGIWETFYIFSRTPIDRSMIGFGVFGLLVYYFSLHYRPLRLLDHMLANVASGLAEALYFFDIGERCVWVNRQGARFLELEEAEYDRCGERLRKVFPDLTPEGDEWACERILTVGGSTRYYAMDKRRMFDRKGRAVGSLLTIRDNTAQEEALRQERYNANHDTLTGLYTKEYLYARIRETLLANPDKIYYISYLDINDFKMINDIFGKDFGDYTLRCFADSLRENLPPGALYGRLSADCFGLCLEEGDFDFEKASRYMTEFTVKNETRSHRVIIHQGSYRVTERDIDVSVMFDRAHMALATVKTDYKKRVALYDDTMREKALWDQRITAELPDALAERQICPYLQAMVDGEGRVVGAEALVRWNHPALGFLPPGRFVPVFEKNGMIADVDRYMWRCACEILARWQAMGISDLFLSINISPKDFYFMDVFAELKGIVKEYGVPPSRLRVEITETVMMTDSAERISILSRLKDEGFLVEMDDFGSGYSSLNMLKDMPVDVVKVDMVFLTRAKDGLRSQTILRNVMNMTRDLGILSLTEGVETEDQYRMLSGMGCRLFQGYYFAKPLPVESFETLFLSAPVRT